MHLKVEKLKVTVHVKKIILYTPSHVKNHPDGEIPHKVENKVYIFIINFVFGIT